ncbi:ROK family glucokinase [Janibacter alkaliphilus]|uniref:Glucokinase n=1 Tax=Janibacter alkaliphilus TaxID=1069963 RepID=A0A852X8R7_9MICO|nr:ROK family glucokinase [Janibacter alkaliphilus]NYG37870.1 glucokinase [Janibacter alkaliphilus]
MSASAQPGAPAIGIDVGGTKIAGALVAPDGQIIHRERVETPAEATEQIVAAVADLVARLRERSDAPVEGIGLAVAAMLDPAAGHIWFAPNLPWRDIDLGAMVAERVGEPVVIENDANAAAWGEYRHGAGVDHDDMVLFTVGTGVGGGCIVDDRLLHGAFGIGGELGHVILDPDGPRCGCGNKGCLEVFASGSALVRAARDLVTSASPLGEALRERCGGDPDRLEGADVTELAQGGDLASTELLEELGTRLGHGIASVCAVLDPRIVVVGGGVSAAGELLLGPARQAFARHLIGRGHRPTPDLVLARLGNDAGVVGAAALAREHRAAGRGEG